MSILRFLTPDFEQSRVISLSAQLVADVVVRRHARHVRRRLLVISRLRTWRARSVFQLAYFDDVDDAGRVYETAAGNGTVQLYCVRGKAPVGYGTNS